MHVPLRCDLDASMYSLVVEPILNLSIASFSALELPPHNVSSNYNEGNFSLFAHGFILDEGSDTSFCIPPFIQKMNAKFGRTLGSPLSKNHVSHREKKSKWGPFVNALGW